jgi:multidrug transporter EmrE-like cation transporter
MKTPLISILFYILASFLGAFGQYLYKSGAERADGTLLGYFANSRLVGGVFCYIAVMVLFIAAFRKGGSLAVLYPIYATTFIWAALLGHYMFGTPIKLINIAGMSLLILGMYLMGK